ncbi:MAG: hypothetical protein COC01_08275 [Bacteroidetes bacterium]|nr:SET domain-containing protein-lysine N-methyltransferase [Bacteroidia bacterium]PCH66332.1 MAG: hypothetical protein COC01_08275 [Bacteroidota bacterium]
MNNCVEVKVSSIHGKGVFAKCNIKKGEVIAESHVILLHHNEQLPEQLATLEFPWDDEYYALCISDVGSFFNHSKQANTRIHQNQDKKTQEFIALCDIRKGDEVMIYYNDKFEEFIR